eukprot:SAG31_NODE_11617_length_1013_cov_0.782276_2_plen_71_part_00
MSTSELRLNFVEIIIGFTVSASVIEEWTEGSYVNMRPEGAAMPYGGLWSAMQWATQHGVAVQRNLIVRVL